MGNDKRGIRLTLTGLMLGLLLASLDQTITSTAMPTVIRDLGGLSLYSWVFSVYMLTSTTSMPIFGKLADLFGRRRMYVIGMTLFIVGSALCGMASNMTELIVFRGIQGIGAGALMPLSMTIIGDIFSPEERGKFQGLFGAVFGLSSIIGPAVGGFITEHLSWNWVFYVNLPFGIAAMIFLTAGLRENKRAGKKPIDWFGAISLSGAIISLLLGLVLGGDSQEGGTTHYAWDSVQIIGLFSISAILLAVFLWIETKVEEPIIPLKLFNNRVISVSSIIGFLMGAGMFGAISYIPLFVQGVIGVKPSLAGYILTPFMLSFIAMNIITGRLINKLAYRTLILPSLVLMGFGFWLLSQMDVNTSSGTVILYMVVAGAGMGPLMPTLGTAMQSAVGKHLRGVSTSMFQFSRSIGGTIGVSIMGVLMANRMTSGLSSLGEKLTNVPADKLKAFANPQALLSQEARSALPQEVLLELQKVFAHSVDGVFVLGLLFIGIGVIAGLFMGNARLPKKDNDDRNGPAQPESTVESRHTAAAAEPI